MATYLIHEHELGIIQRALAEYQNNHCGTECPHAARCSGLTFCPDIVRDIAIGSIDRIEFYENNSVIKEGVEQLVKLGQHQPRWLIFTAKV